jgi:predicted ATPase
LTILATSREALGIGGEWPWRVPSLGLPDPRGRLTLDRVLNRLAGEAELLADFIAGGASELLLRLGRTLWN